MERGHGGLFPLPVIRIGTRIPCGEGPYSTVLRTGKTHEPLSRPPLHCRIQASGPSSNAVEPRPIFLTDLMGFTTFLALTATRGVSCYRGAILSLSVCCPSRSGALSWVARSNEVRVDRQT